MTRETGKMHPSRTVVLAIAASAVAIAAASGAASRQSQSSAPDGSSVSNGRAQTSDPLPDPGSISGNVYTNDSFRMRYEFPKGWFVDRAWIEAQNRPVDPGPRPTDPDQAEKYDAMVATKKGTLALLAVSEQPPDQAKGSGPRIQLSISPVFENKSGAEILNGMKAAYSQMRLVQIVGDPEDVTFGGQRFSRMDMRLLDVILSGGAGFQSAIIGAHNGRYLQFSILANSQEQLDSLVHSLDSLRFE